MKTCLVILFFTISIPLFCQQQAKVDSLLKQLSASGASQRDTIENSIIGILYGTELEEGKQISDSLLQIPASPPYQQLYILVRIHSWRFHKFKGIIQLLNEAYAAAKELKDNNLIGIVEVYKATAFRDNAMTDSAMTYALRARDRLEKTGKPEDLDNVLNLIADLHYYAGHYDEAEKLYRQIISQPRLKNTWMYYTILRDIGQIRIKQKRYSEAENLFNKTLRDLTSKNMRYSDSTALPYIYRMLLEITFREGHYKNAEEYYNLAKKVTERFGLSSYYLPAIYAYKGGLCLVNGEKDSALVFYRKALELHRSSPNFDDAINIYDGLFKTYTAMNNLGKANHYLKLLNKAQVMSDSVFYRTKYMTAYAQYNYSNYLKEISRYKERQTFLIIFISLISISFFTIIYFFVRLGRANRKLVSKNIELATRGENTSAPPVVESSKTKLLQDEPEEIITTENESKRESKKLDEDLIRDIIHGLDKLMLNEKIYLNPEISMDYLSELLKTNRTYLSKAINSAYNVNFTVYINDLRIKEAIRIITSGEHKNFNIEGVAQKAGFNNRVSFTKAFYKSTGVTPSYFIRHTEGAIKYEQL